MYERPQMLQSFFDRPPQKKTWEKLRNTGNLLGSFLISYTVVSYVAQLKED